ncbi:hypothetical protein D3C81_1685090 [compost metagenome]
MFCVDGSADLSLAAVSLASALLPDGLAGTRTAGWPLSRARVSASWNALASALARASPAVPEVGVFRPALPTSWLISIMFLLAG